MIFSQHIIIRAVKDVQIIHSSLLVRRSMGIVVWESSLVNPHKVKSLSQHFNQHFLSQAQSPLRPSHQDTTPRRICTWNKVAAAFH